MKIRMLARMRPGNRACIVFLILCGYYNGSRARNFCPVRSSNNAAKPEDPASLSANFRNWHGGVVIHTPEQFDAFFRTSTHQDLHVDPTPNLDTLSVASRSSTKPGA